MRRAWQVHGAPVKRFRGVPGIRAPGNDVIGVVPTELHSPPRHRLGLRRLSARLSEPPRVGRRRDGGRHWRAGSWWWWSRGLAAASPQRGNEQAEGKTHGKHRGGHTERSHAPTVPQVGRRAGRATVLCGRPQRDSLWLRIAWGSGSGRGATGQAMAVRSVTRDNTRNVVLTRRTLPATATLLPRCTGPAHRA